MNEPLCREHNRRENQRGRPRDTASTKRATLVLVGVFLSFIAGSGLLIAYSKLATRPPAAADRAPADTLVTGRIIVHEPSGCRTYGFNNSNGRVSEGGAASCGGDAPSPGNRLDAIRGSFLNR